jgi:hypothetical protein
MAWRFGLEQIALAHHQANQKIAVLESSTSRHDVEECERQIVAVLEKRLSSSVEMASGTDAGSLEQGRVFHHPVDLGYPGSLVLDQIAPPSSGRAVTIFEVWSN